MTSIDEGEKKKSKEAVDEATRIYRIFTADENGEIEVNPIIINNKSDEVHSVAPPLEVLDNPSSYIFEPSDSINEMNVSDSIHDLTGENILKKADGDGARSASEKENSKTASDDSGNLLSKVENCPYLDGKFFKVVSRMDSNVSAQCRLCLAKTTLIKGKIGVSTNFLKHIRKIHPLNFKEYEIYKMEKKELNNKNNQLKRQFIDTGEHDCSEIKKSKIQKKITNSFQNKNYANPVALPSQEQFDKKIINFISEAMLPISIVESKAFKSLFEGTNLNIMCRATATKKIQDMCKKDMDSIREQLKICKYVCTTADIWSAKRRSFIGITAHWIDSSMNRRSVALACRRFTGAHTFDKIADIIEEINSHFGIADKLVATVTDNGSNFVKAFKDFGIKATEIEDNSNDADEVEDIDESDADENVTFFDLKDLVQSDSSDDLNRPRLPKHIRCASHTINLISTTDIKNVIEKNSNLRTRNSCCVNKCKILWKMSSKPKSAEIVQKVLNQTLSYPGATRWNSFYDSVTQILNQKENIPALFKELHIENQCFRETDFQYLSEYCTIMKPLANGLDILQGDKNIFYGYLMPCIGAILKKFEKLEAEQEKLLYTQRILATCKQSILQRFKHLFDFTTEESKEAMIASFTLPKFKLRWVGSFKNYVTEDLNEVIPKLIIEIISKTFSNIYDGSSNTSNNENNSNQLNTEEKFFELDDQISWTSADIELRRNRIKKKIELELLQYLNDVDTDIIMLNKYPTIKDLFYKYNTCLPASAAVERLFSFAQIINAPRRNALSDKNFESLVLLKANAII